MNIENFSYYWQNILLDSIAIYYSDFFSESTRHRHTIKYMHCTGERLNTQWTFHENENDINKKDNVKNRKIYLVCISRGMWKEKKRKKGVGNMYLFECTSFLLIKSIVSKERAFVFAVLLTCYQKNNTKYCYKICDDYIWCKLK